MLERLLDVDPTSYDPSIPKPDIAHEAYVLWLMDDGNVVSPESIEPGLILVLGVAQQLISFLVRPVDKSASSERADQQQGTNLTLHSLSDSSICSKIPTKKLIL
jgi:hypothetical protein